MSLVLLQEVFSSNIMRRRKSNIKSVLLDQSIISILVIFMPMKYCSIAIIHPEAITGNLNNNQISILHSEIVKVLNLSLQKVVLRAEIMSMPKAKGQLFGFLPMSMHGRFAV